MFKTATAAALILAAISTGASAQVTMKAGQYFTATTFTSVTDTIGICTGLGLKAGATNYGVYTLGANSGGTTPVSLVNAQTSGVGTTASPFAVTPTVCVLGGWPALTPGTPATVSGGASCNPVGVVGGVTIYAYKLSPVSGVTNTVTALNATGTAFSTASTVTIDAFSNPATGGDGMYHTICGIGVASVGSYTGQ